MFGKKCPRCGNKIKSSFKFCPLCSFNLSSEHEKEDYGFLGRDDFVEEPIPAGFANSFMDKMFNNTMRMLEKQMKNLNNEMNNPGNRQHYHRNNQGYAPGLNVHFFVNGRRVFPGGPVKKFNPNTPRISSQPISIEKFKRFADLPRVEPETRMKRLGGKVIYEMTVPGVKDIDNILINRLESSIEIKAFSEEKVYSKNLNIKLPILRYGLKGDDLFIEMAG